MTRPGQPLSSNLRRLPRALLSLTVLCVLPMLAVRPAQAQTFSVIHAFTGKADGFSSYASVTFGGADTFYGTTAFGGGVSGRNCFPRTMGCGAVFRMTRHNGLWNLSPLYGLTGSDGMRPTGPVAFGPGNLLFGSARFGGNLQGQCGESGCGTIFTLRPPPTVCNTTLCRWSDDTIYQFAAQNDGEEPEGSLAFDQAGNVYGTTLEGGACGGTIFQLTRSGASWSETTVHNFLCGSDGGGPTGVIIDAFGNLYGVVGSDGAYGYGGVFEAKPSGSGWTESLIYSFQNGSDGEYPNGGLVMDAEGNLYGATDNGGVNGGGTVFELSPSGGGWNFSLIVSLSSIAGRGLGATGSMAFDSAGNLYGTTYSGGQNLCGNVFKVTHSGGQWAYSDLYDFSCGDDGAYPWAGPALDSSGNIYGTTSEGGPPQDCIDGSPGCGVVWEITP